MAQKRNPLTRLLHELRRRKTFQAAATYIVFAWVLIEGASVVLPAFAAPDWVLPAFIIALAMGLPVAVVISWIFDLTLSGFERTEPEVETADGLGQKVSKEAPAVVKPSVVLELGTARRRPVSLLRCSFELVCDGKTVSDPEALMSLRAPFDELIDSTAEHFTAKCVERSALSYELLFGFPIAFENDALRACAAAFSLQHRAVNLQAPTRKYVNASIVASIGLHSDTVIIDADSDINDEVSIVGDISEVATWLQSVAAAGSITLSSSVYSLLRDKISVKSLGKRKNHHTGDKLQVFAAQAILPHDQATLTSPDSQFEMIGRESELALLLDRWQLAREGEDQIVMLRGESGIGKSTLVREMVARAQQSDDTQVIPLYCSPIESDHTFYPIIEYFLGSSFGSVDPGALDSQRQHIAELLDVPGLSSADADSLQTSLFAYSTAEGTGVLQGKSAVQSRRDLQQSLVKYMSAVSRRGPILVAIEDIQWADPSTLECVEMLMRGGVGIGLFCLFTCRPETTFDWMSRNDVFVLDLQRLPRRATEILIKKTAADKELSDAVLSKIIAESDGNPFFAEELTRAVAENYDEDSDQLVMPGSVQQSLASRMDKLGSAQPLLQLCSLLGKRFDYKLLYAVSEAEDERALQKDLRVLVNVGLLFQDGTPPDSSYRFRHILMQEAAHNSLLRETRARQHSRIAAVIESRFAEKVQRRPELLAYHYSAGAQPSEAVFYRIKAARKSLRGYAIQEGIKQAEKGLIELDLIPASPQRDALEVTLQSLSAKGLLAMRGYGDPTVERSYARALALTEGLKDTPQLFQLVVGLWMYFFIAGEAEHAIELAHRLVRIAKRTESAAKTLQAQYCLGHSLFRLGRFKESLEQLELALETEKNEDDFSSESASGDDTRIHVRAVLAHVLWYMGDDARSVEMSSGAREMAEELGNPFGIVFAAFMSSWLCMVRGDAKGCAEYAARTEHVAEERGFKFWVPLAQYMKAWASNEGGSSADDETQKTRIQLMEESMRAFRRGGGANGETTLSLQIAEDCIAAGYLDQANDWLTHAAQAMEETGEVFMQPDIERLYGLLLAHRGNLAAAEKKLVEAQALAHNMGCTSLAQRAADAIDAVHNGDFGYVKVEHDSACTTEQAPLRPAAGAEVSKTAID